MENTPALYETLLRVLGQHANWLDLRHRKTLAWMMVGLICSKTVSLGAWTPFVVSPAQYAQSLVRRFRRWLDNNRITVEPLYGPLIESLDRAGDDGLGRQTDVCGLGYLHVVEYLLPHPSVGDLPRSRCTLGVACD